MSALRSVAGLLLLVTTGAAAQQREGNCLLEILNVDRQGVGSQPLPGVQNWFAGGNVRMRCVGQDVWMWADSVASYQGQVIQFIGAVRYRDSTVDMTTDFGTYFRGTERWEARGSVVVTNRKSGAMLVGPMLDYSREVPGVRDTSELYAETRPTITVPARDSLGAPEPPYVIVSDRVRIRGEDRFFASGRVTVDREDLEARADSMRLDTGAGSDGTLVGHASVRRTTADSFDLRGRRIDFTLEERQIRWILSRGEAEMRATELHLVADTIGVDVEEDAVTRVVAWGDSTRPHARSVEGYEVRGDSVAFDTPERRLREARAFGDAWMGAEPDSATGERDWIGGDSVVVRFDAADDSTGTTRTVLERLESRGDALAFYRLPQQNAEGGRDAIVYTRAACIVITMKRTPTGESAVDEVRSVGDVDGIHLQPTVIVRDTTRVVPPPRPGTVPR